MRSTWPTLRRPASVLRMEPGYRNARRDACLLYTSNIREVVAIVHVVRCFEDDDIVHVDGGVDPARDMETINLELIFACLLYTSRCV